MKVGKLKAATRRNVVVILCDQLRPDFLSIYGCQAIPTPNLDRLARLGVVFDRAITVSTVCAPARASMMTGRYVSDHGVWTNDVPFRDGMEYLAERMNDLGYATGAFGKLHHFPANDVKGFQVARQMDEGRLGEDEPYLAWLRVRDPDVARMFNSHDGQFDFPEGEHYEHWIASEALSFVEDTVGQSSAQPFLAWVSFQGPHGPLDAPAEAKGTVDAGLLPQPLRKSQEAERSAPPIVRSRTIRSNMPEGDALARMRLVYAEQMVTIDRQMGRIIARIEQLGVLDQTTIIFSADHGDMLGDFRLYDLANDPDETTNLADRAEFAAVRADLLGHIIDFMVVAKGIRIEARDLVPEKQAGAAAKHPDYQHDFTVCFPLSARERELLEAADFPNDYNEFCRDKPVTRCYSRPYWETES